MARHSMRARRQAGQAAAGEPAASPPPPPGDPGALARGVELTVAALDRLADDPRYSADEQQTFVREAVGLRRRLAQLDSAQFDANSAGYAEAAAALGAVNRALGEAAGRLERLPELLTLLARVAGAIDGVVGAVT